MCNNAKRNGLQPSQVVEPTETSIFKGRDHVVSEVSKDVIISIVTFEGKYV